MCVYLPLVTVSSLVVVDHRLLLLLSHDRDFWLQMWHSLFEVHEGPSEGDLVRNSMIRQRDDLRRIVAPIEWVCHQIHLALMVVEEGLRPQSKVALFTLCL